jgi:hypothetical protein
MDNNMARQIPLQQKPKSWGNYLPQAWGDMIEFIAKIK